MHGQQNIKCYIESECFTLLVLRKKDCIYPSILKYFNLVQVPYTVYLDHLTCIFEAFHFFFFYIADIDLTEISLVATD